MGRLTKKPHDHSISNQNSFDEKWNNLSKTGTQKLKTNAGIPFSAKAHVTSRAKHEEKNCILIQVDCPAAPYSIYVYDCCWGHKTNCSGVYIDSYTPLI